MEYQKKTQFTLAYSFDKIYDAKQAKAIYI